MFQLRAFGGLRLERDGEPYTGPATQRRRLALLALLSASEAAVSRDRLTSLLWPDADPERARHSLDDALSALRRELRRETLFLGVASLRVNPDVLWSDLAEQTEALRAGDTERAVALYTGPFLDGFFIPGAGEFDRWVESERSRRAQLFVRALDGLADAASARGDRAAVVRWRQARVDADTLDTPAALRLMDALVASDQRVEALRVARVHESLVRQELDITPGHGWSAAVDGIRETLSHTPATGSIARKPMASHQPVSAPLVADPPSVDATPSSSAPPTPPWTSVFSRMGFAASGRSAAWWAIAAALVILVAIGAYVLSNRERIEPLRPTGSLAGTAATQTSIAVLPFANTGGVADEAFSDGLTDELIGVLSTIGGIRVTGRTSAFALKGKDLTVRAIADTLDVSTVLESSFRRIGNRVRITAQLVNASDNGVLWSGTFDRELQDVFDVQAEIARAIVGALLPTLSGHAVALRPIVSRDIATYELYLKGRHFWGRRGPGDLRLAVAHLERAVARDSTYAQAYAGLADARVMLVLLGDSPPRDEVPRARIAALRAIQLDSTLAEAHAALGNILEAFDYDSSRADRELKRAIELDPGYVTAHLFRGIHLLNRGRIEEAIAQLSHARRLDPLSAPVHMQIGRAYLALRRSDDAVFALRAAIELSPEFNAAFIQLGDAHLQRGESQLALNAYRRAAVLKGGRDSAQIVYGLAMTGQRQEAERLLLALLSPTTRRYWPPVPIARAYVALGNTDAAFRWLERGYDERAAQMNTITVTHAFEVLHRDRRWQQLLRRMRAAS
jgi:TolB-like protein/DNA-binding SARP family transcriptional activator